MAAFVEILEKRNILLLGPIGSGKATILKILTGTTCCESEKGIDGLSREPTLNVVEGTKGSVLYRFLVLDTSSVAAKKHSSLDKNFRKAESIAVEGFNLILIVLRKGFYTIEGALNVHDLLKNNLLPSFHDICAIVHTGCENLNNSHQDIFMKTFQSDGAGLKLSPMAKKGHYCVGFPDVEEEPDFRERYMKRIEEDKKLLEKLIENSDQRLPVNRRDTVTANSRNHYHGSLEHGPMHCLLL